MTKTPSGQLRRPEISCIIPTYNDRVYLGAAVRSVLDQEGVDVECVLIDDCSDSETRTFVADLASSDRRIKAFFLTENGGQSIARNIGVTIAAAPLVTFLDQDDLHCPDWYRFARDAFRNHPEMGSLSGRAHVVNIPERFSIDETDLRIQGLSAVFMTNIVCRRSAFLATGGFPRDAIWRSPDAGEDGVFRVALLRCCLGKSCDVPALVHRAREGGATVHFLDRSWIDGGQVRIRGSELEKSGALQAAVDDFLAEAKSIHEELTTSWIKDWPTA